MPRCDRGLPASAAREGRVSSERVARAQGGVRRRRANRSAPWHGMVRRPLCRHSAHAIRCRLQHGVVRPDPCPSRLLDPFAHRPSARRTRWQCSFGLCLAELTRGELAHQHHSSRPAGAVLSPAAQCRTSGAAWHGAMRRVAARRGTLWDSVMRGHMWRGRALWPSLARGASISSSVRLRLVCDGVCASVAGRTHGARLLERPQRVRRAEHRPHHVSDARTARTHRERGWRASQRVYT
jgi:hypothetical protein